MRDRVLFVALAFLITLSVPARAQSVVYSSNINAGKRIALTFDDGPHPRLTSEILDILDEYGIKSTFFIIGKNAENYPDALKKIVSRGHELGNHTYSHNILRSMTKENIEKELFEAEIQVQKIVDYKFTLLRPPCGLYDDTLISVANEKELKIVLWALDTHDWAHRSASNMAQYVIKNAKDGDIILFHDYVSGVYNTPSALKRIIPSLLEQGYEFVTVSELLQNAT